MNLTSPRIGEIRIVCNGLRYKLQKYCNCGMFWWKSTEWVDLGKYSGKFFCIAYYISLEEAINIKQELEKLHDWKEVKL